MVGLVAIALYPRSVLFVALILDIHYTVAVYIVLVLLFVKCKDNDIEALAE